MSSLSAWFVMYFVFPLCIFKPTFRLSEFRLFRCFSTCFVVSLKRATSSANLKLVRFSPSTLTRCPISLLTVLYDFENEHENILAASPSTALDVLNVCNCGLAIRCFTGAGAGGAGGGEGEGVTTVSYTLCLVKLCL